MYDAYQDSPSDDDTGFDDDGRDSEDAYSAFSPKPYHHEEEESSDSDITEDEGRRMMSKLAEDDRTRVH